MKAPALGWWCAAVFAAGCTCGRSTAECSEPSLWYAPDPSGGVFWGCTPPTGWLAQPPGGVLDTARLAAAARAVREPGVIVPPERGGDAHDTSVVSTASTAGTAGTAGTGDTAVFVDTDGGPGPLGDTATVVPGNTAAPVDTATPVDTAAAVDTVGADTSSPPVDTAAPADAAQPADAQPDAKPVEEDGGVP